MTLATDEFIRRFMLHILPKGFHRIRHYGLFATMAARRQYRAGCASCLARRRLRRQRNSPVRTSPRRPSCHALSLLRRAHDRHRGLRARMHAEAPAHACQDEDRHVMTALSYRAPAGQRWFIAGGNLLRPMLSLRLAGLSKTVRRGCAKPHPAGVQGRARFPASALRPFAGAAASLQSP